MICYGTCPVLSCPLACGTLEGRAVPSSTLVSEEELGPGQALGMEGGGGGGGFSGPWKRCSTLLGPVIS